MSTFVIDASAALAWMLRSQSTPGSAAFLEARYGEDFVAPHIFSWEVGNVLLSLSRRRGLLDDAHSEALTSLDALGVKLQPALMEAEIRELDLLARRRGLSLFDAAYLALAIDCGGALVSRDEGLLAAGRSERIDCVDLREDASS